MKKLFFSMMFAALQLAAFAVPVKPGIWKTVTLTDGTQVKVERKGDEYGSFWRAADGRCFVRQANSDRFVKADMAEIKRKAVEARMANPLPRIANANRGTADAAAPQRVSLGGEHPNFVGEKKGLIILVEFTDEKFREGHDAEYYSHMANDINFSHPDGHVGSIRDYFRAQSEGQFDLTFDVVGPVQLQYNMEYYGGNSVWGGDKNAAAMVKEAVQAAANELGTFEPYDWFNDGYVDQVFVLYAGRGEADQDADPNTIWPHRSEISRTKLGGKYVKTYACANEMQSDTEVDGIGTFCHEFSHCLGLADLYDVNYGENNGGVEFYGMGYWDVMDTGCYLGDGYRPCGYSGFEKNYCGWKEPVILTEDTVVTDLKGMSDGGDYYIIYNDAHKDEYYVLENRTRTGWDAGLFGDGLMITHVDFDATVWSYNLPNSRDAYGLNDHPRYTPFLADNSEAVRYWSDIAGDLYPWKTNNMLTNFSTPASTLYNRNIDGTLFMSKPVTNIVKNSDGTVSFSFANELNKTNELPADVLFLETFEHCYGVGGNDDVWTGTNVGVGTFFADNNGWTSSQTKYAGNGCGCFGQKSGLSKSDAVTPTITLEGNSVLTFRAAPVDKLTTLTVSVNSGEATLSQTSLTLASKQWTEFEAYLDGEGEVTLKFLGNSNGKRFFLDDVQVKKAEETAIVNISANYKNDSRVYTIDGRYAGESIESLPAGLYVVGGKKIIK